MAASVRPAPRPQPAGPGPLLPPARPRGARPEPPVLPPGGPRSTPSRAPIPSRSPTAAGPDKGELLAQLGGADAAELVRLSAMLLQGGLSNVKEHTMMDYSYLTCEVTIVII